MRSFSEVCEENYERIFKYVRAMLGNQSQVEDITQEVFVIAYLKGNDFLNHEKPAAFLYVTAKNLVYEFLRKEKRENRVELDENINLPAEPDAYESLCYFKDQNIDENLYITYITDFLSEEKKYLFEAYYINHKPMKEIARELNISDTALRMKYVRLRKEIKENVKKLHLGEI